MTRRERERLICQRVTRRIGEVAPEGIGRWDPAWEIVAPPSDAFLDVLDAWLNDDSPDTRAALQAAADDLVRAWREAGRRYQEARQGQGREVPA
ncbi:MAG TPA: hypothetical protein VKA44_07795 [Gemmatimonadota bacterium]|nr:hypothetical protein [Gemmatimonadota bacterium]